MTTDGGDIVARIRIEGTEEAARKLAALNREANQLSQVGGPPIAGEGESEAQFQARVAAFKKKISTQQEMGVVGGGTVPPALTGAVEDVLAQTDQTTESLSDLAQQLRALRGPVKRGVGLTAEQIRLHEAANVVARIQKRQLVKGARLTAAVVGKLPPGEEPVIPTEELAARRLSKEAIAVDETEMKERGLIHKFWQNREAAAAVTEQQMRDRADAAIQALTGEIAADFNRQAVSQAKTRQESGVLTRFRLRLRAKTEAPPTFTQATRSIEAHKALKAAGAATSQSATTAAKGYQQLIVLLQQGKVELDQTTESLKAQITALHEEAVALKAAGRASAGAVDLTALERHKQLAAVGMATSQSAKAATVEQEKYLAAQLASGTAISATTAALKEEIVALRTEADALAVSEKSKRKGYGFGARRMTKETAEGMQSLSSAAQGAMMSFSALQGNIQGVLFSLIFLQFAFPKIALAVAAFTTAGGLGVKQLMKMRNIAKDVRSLSGSLRLVGYSSAFTADALKSVSEVAEDFNFDKNEKDMADATKAMGILIGSGLKPGAEEFATITKIAFASGRSIEETAKAFVDLLKPSEFTVGSLEDFRAGLDALIPASVRSQNGVLDLFQADAQLFSLIAGEGLDSQGRMATMLGFTTDRWTELGAVNKRLFDENGDLVVSLDEIEDSLYLSAVMAGKVEPAFGSLRDAMDRLGYSSDVTFAELSDIQKLDVLALLDADIIGLIGSIASANSTLAVMPNLLSPLSTKVDAYAQSIGRASGGIRRYAINLADLIKLMEDHAKLFPPLFTMAGGIHGEPAFVGSGALLYNPSVTVNMTGNVIGNKDFIDEVAVAVGGAMLYGNKGVITTRM